MPIYQYHCHACQSEFETHQSIRDDALVSCLLCSEDAVERVLFPPTIFDATPRTLGAQADRNEGPGRRYWLDKQHHELEQSRHKGREKLRELYPNMVADTETQYERPYWRDSDVINTKLNDLSPQEKVNYIMTGKSSEPLTPSVTTCTSPSSN